MASGNYHYLLNGQAMQVTESWKTEGELASHCQIFSQRSAPGVDIEVTAQLSAGIVENFTSTWRAGSEEPISAVYSLKPDRVQISWRGASSTAEEAIKIFHDSAISQALLFPLMRIFTGPLIARLLQQGGEGAVVLPNITSPEDKEQLLRPLCTQRSARIIGDEVLVSPDGVSTNCRCCEYTGDQYTADSRFWLREDDLLQRYQWQQADNKHWDVWLQSD